MQTRVFGGGKLFYLELELFYLQLSFFADSPLRCFLDTLPHCKQRSSTVSKKAQIVSKKAQMARKKAPKHNCKQTSSAVSRKLPTVSKKAASFLESPCVPLPLEVCSLPAFELVEKCGCYFYVFGRRLLQTPASPSLWAPIVLVVVSLFHPLQSLRTKSAISFCREKRGADKDALPG